MKESLKRLIKNFILPDFPWVEDFEVIEDENESSDFVTGNPEKYKNYTIVYSPDYNLIDDDNKKELKRLELYTKKAAKMLGWEKGFRFGAVVFRTPNGKFLMLSNTPD